jgi:hypothetical protein
MTGTELIVGCPARGTDVRDYHYSLGLPTNPSATPDTRLGGAHRSVRFGPAKSSFQYVGLEQVRHQLYISPTRATRGKQ